MAATGVRPPVAKRNALPNATAYHRDMPDGPRRIDWEWEEIVLACDLVAQNGWHQLDESDPRVQELSGLLRRMSMHPFEARLPSFRNAAGVARKTYNIATVHPDYMGPPSNGNKLDKKVLDEFLDDPEQMHRYARSLRQAAVRDELVLQPDFVIFMVRGLVAGSGRFWPGAGGAAATSTIAAGAGCFWPGR
jgi:hypothetical protein